MTEPADTIRGEILREGPMTFARFMELSLYGPNGYYTSGSPISASGDFFTAPSAHPVFGALLAVQLREMWTLLGSPGEFTVVEQGASSGGLAADITEFADRLDGSFAKSLNYRAIDKAPTSSQEYPVAPLNEIPKNITGCILSNELLDAMPVHIFEKRDGELLELLVGLEGNEFTEVLSSPTTAEIDRHAGPFSASMPDGYRGEINTGLDSWTAFVAKTLERGWALTIDYGFDRAELYKPERTAGSLRCYYQHTLGQNPLLDVGKQDITAHVDFTAVNEAMAQVGLSAVGDTTQSEFLHRLGFEQMIESLNGMPLRRPDLRANLAGINALTDPDGMGGFRVAAHSKNVDGLALSGVSPDGTGIKPDHLPSAPLLKPGRHINLLGASQPGHFEVESFEDLFRD